MTKGPSEGIFREALNKVDIDPFYAYKPADALGSGMKPADYLAWWYREISLYSGGVEPVGMSAWFEVKETTNKAVFPMSEIRASQVNGILLAKRLGIPYFLAIRWRADRMWSLVDAVRLLDWWHGHGDEPAPSTTMKGVGRELLESRFGVGCTVGQLPSMIRTALIEGL